MACPLESCCGHRIPAGEASSLLAAPASAPSGTEDKGSTQGSREGPGEVVDIAIGPPGSCLGRCVAVQGRGTHGYTRCVQECVCACMCARCVSVPGIVDLQILVCAHWMGLVDMSVHDCVVGGGNRAREQPS